MFDVGVDSIAGTAVHHGGSHITAQHAILGIILEITAAEGVAVGVHARAVPAPDLAIGKLCAQRLAGAVGEVGVPGLADQHRRGERGSVNANVPVVQAGAAVGVHGLHLAHRLHGHRLEAAQVYKVEHFIKGQLIQKLLPLRVIVGFAGEIRQAQAIVRAGDRHFIVRIVIPCGVIIGHGFFRDAGQCIRIHGIGFFRWSCRRFGIIGKAVRAGKIGHVAGGIVLELIGGYSTVGRAAVCAVVHIAFYRKGHAVQHGVGICPDGQRIFPCLQHIAAVGRFDTAGIIGGEILLVDGEADRLGRARLQLGSLGKLHQIDRSLFNAAVRIRRREVNLHHVLTGHIAGIGYVDGEGYRVPIVGKVHDLLGKAGVAQTVTKGILDRGIVIDQTFLCGR